VQKLYKKQIKQLGKEVKKLREQRKMTQQELADLCEVDIRTVQRIEAGEFGSGLPILFALSEALKVAPSKLLETVSLV